MHTQHVKFCAYVVFEEGGKTGSVEDDDGRWVLVVVVVVHGKPRGRKKEIGCQRQSGILFSNIGTHVLRAAEAVAINLCTINEVFT